MNYVLLSSCIQHRFPCVSQAFSHYYSSPLALFPFAVTAAVNRNGQHQSNNSHGSIQRRWQHFLEVDNQSAQSYCVITQKVEPWDLIWTSSAALSPVFTIQNQIMGQHLFCPSWREITIVSECRVLFRRPGFLPVGNSLDYCCLYLLSVGHNCVFTL